MALRNPLPTLLPRPRPEDPPPLHRHCLAGRLGSGQTTLAKNGPGASSLHCPEPGAVARKFHEEDVGIASVGVAIQEAFSRACNHQVVVLVHLQWGSSGALLDPWKASRNSETHLEPAKTPAETERLSMTHPAS